MKIAVIGATGRLGSAVTQEAAARGHQVTPLNRSSVDAADPASVAGAVTGLTLAQDDSDQVVRAGGVITFLHPRRDFVVRLCSHGGQTYLGGVITKSAKGFYVGHGK